MSLIKCPECGKEISDKAISCPTCGNPMTEKNNVPQEMIVVQKKESSIGVWIILTIIIIAILGATGVFSNATASSNLNVQIAEGRVNALGACYVKGQITNTGTSDVTDCTITFNLVSDATKEYIGKASTKFSTIKARETLNYEANGVCNSNVTEAKWKVDIKCGDNNN